jgi:hypothetical protein
MVVNIDMSLRQEANIHHRLKVCPQDVLIVWRICDNPVSAAIP